MAHGLPHAPLDEEEEEIEGQEREVGNQDAPAHHPPAPPDELFDISTTVDPSYIISLIRKLLPPNTSTSHKSHDVEACVARSQESNTDNIEETTASLSGDKVLNSSINQTESMDIVDDCDKCASHEGEDEESCHRSEKPSVSAQEEAWEEFGCVLWDLAASKTHAELMVQNLVLEVLLANLLVSESARVTEISLGIIGNLACHEVSLKHIVSTNGLIEIIVDQLFLDDTPCLCEACRSLTLGLQSSEGITWAELLQSERILCRILWIAENTLNPQLIEKSVGLILAMVEGQPEAMHVLLPSMIKLGLPSLLINLLDFEMSKLMSERIADRYSILDVILRTIEALSVLDNHSQEICSNKELFGLVCDLIKFSDKVEVADSCVTAAVLIANILYDVTDLASEISQDLPFLQGLLDIFPFASDDIEARNAIWSIIASLLVQVRENEISQSNLYEYVMVLVRKSDLIEDDLLNYQLDDSSKEQKGLTPDTKSDTRTIALRRIISILNQWTASKDSAKENDMMGEHCANDVNIGRLLDCCRKYSEFNAGSCFTD